MALDDDVRDLARNPTLSALGPDALRLIAFSCEARILRAGDILFRRGDASDGGFVLRSGSLALESDSPTTVVRPPALIGDTALLVETRRPATALAREPSSVLKISRALFRRVLDEFPDDAVRLHATLAERLRDLGRDLGGMRG